MLGMSWSRREGVGSRNEAGVAEDSEPEVERRVWQWWGNQENTCLTFQPSSGGGEGESHTPIRGCRRSSVPRFPFEREGEGTFK